MRPNTRTSSVASPGCLELNARNDLRPAGNRVVNQRVVLADFGNYKKASITALGNRR
jgi:hypothetical protein